MSLITFDTEQRPGLDPWDPTATTVETVVGWQCTCGTTQPAKLGKHQLDWWAAQHLIAAHGAPPAMSTDCLCGGAKVLPHAMRGDLWRQHEYVHARWLLEVWDA